ncbi:unnamed protein product [Debaryomyces tyrocola]|nr:unnamed protein product [Debaryomyces tyrocola]
MSSNCIVTLAPGSQQDENIVHKRIEKIFKSNPIVHDVSVILNSKSLPLDIGMLVGNIQKFELDEFKKLPELIQKVSAFKSDDFVIIEAIPIHQVWDNTDLDIIDSIQFSSVTGQIKLKLNKSTFQSSPNIFDSQKGILIKKIIESKKGHGALNHVSYSYLITLSTVEEDISYEMHHLIKSVFGYSTVKVHTNNTTNISHLLDENKAVGRLSKMPKMPSKLNVNYLEFNDVDFHEQSQTIYEYLNLLHINSQQLTETIDDYISSYQIPESIKRSTEELKPDQELYKHTFDEIDFPTFHSLMKNHCLTISAYVKNSHIMVLNIPDASLLWECQ